MISTIGFPEGSTERCFIFSEVLFNPALGNDSDYIIDNFLCRFRSP